MLLLILGSHINKNKYKTNLKKIKKWKKIKKINEKNIPKRTGNYRRLVEKDQNIQDWKI
jgi:hypothetical protein